MKFKKLCTTLSIFTLITTSCVFAQDTFQQQQQEVVEETIISEKVPELKAASLINTVAKSNDFSDSFWCDESEGDTLNIYLKNNGKQAVQHKIIHGKNTTRSKGTIKPGEKVQLRLGPDRSGKWTIKVYTTDGTKMNVKVEARQF